MHVRKKKNRGGTTSVLLIEKVDGASKVIKNFGVASDDTTLKNLEIQAYDYLRSLRGPELDLFEDPFETKFKEVVTSLSNSDIKIVGPELIFGALYDRIGYGAIKSEIFRHLVICRLFNPGSKLKTVDYLYRYLHISYEVDKIYRFLDRLCDRKTNGKEGGIKEQVDQITFDYSKKVVGGKIDVVFYDMTTLYFEAADEDDLRKTGFSKDGKHSHPQIFLGLLVTRGGNPLGYEIFEGNIFEGNTLIPVIKALEGKYDFNQPTVIADAGLLTKRNIEELERLGYPYILGARMKNMSKAMQEEILKLRLNDGELALLPYENKKLIVSYSDARAKKDAQNRRRGIVRLEKRVKNKKLTKSNINNRGYNKFLRLEGDIEVTIDYAKIEAEKAWDGLKGYITNTRLSKEEVVENYGYLNLIERAFRMNKTDLQMRPIYHRIENRIRGHILICFTAYTVLLELERILKRAQSSLSIDRARELVRTIYQINYTHGESKKRYQHLLKMDAKQQELYDLIKNLD